MSIATAIVECPIMILTGAGASVPLGLRITRQFAEDLILTPEPPWKTRALHEIPHPRTNRAEWAVKTLQSLSSNEQGDVETALDLLERRARATMLLAEDHFAGVY